MKTVLQTGPGFYAANTSQVDAKIPPGVLRVYCARVEAYDMEKTDPAMDDIQFELLVAKAEKDPELAKALLQLVKSLSGNIPLLERIAKGS